MTRTARLPAVVAVSAIALIACRSAGATSLRPSLAPSDLQTGITLYDQGKFAQAEAVFRGLGGPMAQAYLAASIAQLKRYSEAEPLAEAVLKDEPLHDVALAALGLALVGQKKYDEAVGRMSAALAENASLAPAYLWRGQAYQHQKQTARMVEDYEAFLRLAPKAPEAPAIRAILAGLR